MPRLSGNVGIITGSSGGIGHAAALEFGREGADLVLQYGKNEQQAQKLAEEIRAMGRKAIVSQVDFMEAKSAPGQVQRMVDAGMEKFGQVDFLLNLAGYPAKGEWNKRFLDLTPEDFFKPINVDLFGSFLCAKAVAPHMLKRKRGVIVNVSSTPALAGHDRGFSFTVAKAGIIGLTKALAFELAPHIRVNTVALGNVETEWVKELDAKEHETGREENLIKRFGSPEEIARSLVFLCSEDSSFINGQTLVLDGGTFLH